MGRGEKCLLCDPGSELRLAWRETIKAKIINGMEKKGKTKKGYALSDGSRHHSDIIRHHTRTGIIVAASSSLSLTFRYSYRGG